MEGIDEFLQPCTSKREMISIDFPKPFRMLIQNRNTISSDKKPPLTSGKSNNKGESPTAQT
jgi:hypothetical protein